MFSHFSRTPTCDGHTDTQTNRQTHDHGIYRASIASRGKNPERFILLVPAFPGCPGKKAVKWLLLFYCVCIRQCLISAVTMMLKLVSRLPMLWHWHCWTIVQRWFRCWYVIGVIYFVCLHCSVSGHPACNNTASLTSKHNFEYGQETFVQGQLHGRKLAWHTDQTITLRLLQVNHNCSFTC